MKSLVLGADGFLGRCMCSYLIKNGKQVRAFDLSQMDDLRDVEGIECIQGNLQMIDSMDELFVDVDEVYHFVCTTVPHEGTRQIPQEIELNLIPLTKLLQKLHEHNIEKFLFISSAGTIYGEGEITDTNHKLSPICSYGVLKQVSESYIEFYNRICGHSYKIARVSNPYGYDIHRYKTQGIIPIYIRALVDNKPINVWGDGSNLRDYIYVEDVIDALSKIINLNGEEYLFNVGSGHSYSINEIIEIIQQETGLDFANINYIESRKCDVKTSIIDISSTTEILKWNPKVSLRDGVRLTFQLMKQ